MQKMLAIVLTLALFFGSVSTVFTTQPESEPASLSENIQELF